MSDRPAKPKDMGWISPYLYVKDVARTQKFYEEAFGFETGMSLPGPDGSLMHLEMHYRDAVIMIGAEDERQQVKAPGSLGGSPGGLYVYVDDVDGFHDQVKNAGGEIMAAPETKFWGDRVFAAKCPEGHQWFFAQNVKDFDPADVPG